MILTMYVKFDSLNNHPYLKEMNSNENKLYQKQTNFQLESLWSFCCSRKISASVKNSSM